jgi:hypothetical protein
METLLNKSIYCSRFVKMALLALHRARQGILQRDFQLGEQDAYVTLQRAKSPTAQIDERNCGSDRPERRDQTYPGQANT